MPNVDPMLDRLFEAARGEAPDTSRAEYAFESRLMARIREEQSSSIYAWAWKLAPFFAAVVIAVGLWNRPSAAELNGTATMVADAVRQHPNRIFLSLVDRDH
jgi:hypothetical protein